MPYLEPEDENKKAQEYFEENENKIAQCIDDGIYYFDEVRFFISESDNTPYIAIVLRSYCPLKSADAETYDLNEVIERIFKSYRAFPELTHSPIFLGDIFEFVVVKRNPGGQSSFKKLLWPNDLVAPGDEYEEE
ncbi:hypothetical protein M434DRAFT_383526 [Hypoxylon sp. CO27-5]|nr:hypothetical protein M434DRAFT_383526 [Hypoxylon sp. CO27-5]